MFFVFLWLLSLFCSSYLIFYTVVSSNTTQPSLLILNKYCLISPAKYLMSFFHSIIIQRCILFGNYASFKCIHSDSLVQASKAIPAPSQHQPLPRTSPEKRATQTILLLVSFFFVIYWVDLSISSFSIILWAYSPFILGVQRLVGTVYATVSPLVLISSEKRIISILQILCQMFHRLKKNYEDNYLKYRLS